MSEKEIDICISECRRTNNLNQAEMDLLEICQRLNVRLSELEKRFEDAEAGNRRTANIASCLANGIQPD